MSAVSVAGGRTCPTRKQNVAGHDDGSCSEVRHKWNRAWAPTSGTKHGRDSSAAGRAARRRREPPTNTLVLAQMSAEEIGRRFRVYPDAPVLEVQ